MRLWTGVFYTDNEFKQMPLIQVTSGGQRSLLKKKLQVCESQQSCLFVGDQILIFHHNFRVELYQQLLWQVEIPQLAKEVQPMMGLFYNGPNVIVPLQVLRDGGAQELE